MDQCMTDLKQHQYNYNQKLHVSRNRKKICIFCCKNVQIRAR